MFTRVINVINGISILLSILSLFLIFFWLIKSIIFCWRKYKNYLLCKRTPNLHPIYSDVQFLSQQRTLYNLKTHIIKYILIIVCSCVELFNLLWFIISYIIQLETPVQKNDTYVSKFEESFPNCTYKHLELHFNFHSIYVPFYNVNFICFLLVFALLSILTRYLVARYLNHDFKPTLIKYIVWCFVQIAVIAICSTLYTMVLALPLFPILVFICWIIFIRDSLILSRVLKSNLRDLQLYGDSKFFYKQQLSAYRFYMLFRRVLFVSTFFLALSISFIFSVEKLVALPYHRFCLFSLIYNIHIPNYIYDYNKVYSLSEEIIRFVCSLFTFIYAMGMAVPLCVVTFSPIVSKCIRRWKEKEDDYIYNYEKLNLINK